MSARAFLLAILALPLLAIPALAQGVYVEPGQTAPGSVDSGMRMAVFRFDVLAGDAVSLKLAASKAAPLDMEVNLFDPAGEQVNAAPLTGEKVSGSFTVGATGTCLLTVIGRGGSNGDFTLSLKTKSAKRAPVSGAFPGEISVDLRRGEVLKVSGTTGGPDVELDVLGPDGSDILDHASVKAGKGKVSFTTYPASFTGPHRIRFASAGAGTVTLKLSSKLAKPAVTKLTPADVIHTFAAGTKDGDDEQFMVEVMGEGLQEVRIAGPFPGSPRVVPEVDPGEFALEDDLAGWLDLWCRFEVIVASGATRVVPFRVGGDWPAAVTILGLSDDPEPVVTFSAGAGDKVFHLAVTDPGAEGEVFEALLAGSERSFTLPAGLLTAGWPFEIELEALTPGLLLAGDATSAGGAETGWVGPAAAGDLIEVLFDTVDLDFQLTVLEPSPGSMSGTLERENDYGRYVYRMPAPDPGMVVVLPGRIAVGQAMDAGFAVVPRRSTDYVPGEIAGLYNLIVWVGEDIGNRDTGYGTLRIEAGGTFSLWQEKNASGTPDLSGNWTDDGDGVIRARLGTGELVASVSFSPGPQGNLVVLDIPNDIMGPGIGLGMTQAPVPVADGVYDMVFTDGEGIDVLDVRGKTLTSEDGEKVALKLDSPWTGFFTGGSPDDGGIGLVSPDGVVFIGEYGVYGTGIGGGVKE
jgi:hypothetical protein